LRVASVHLDVWPALLTFLGGSDAASARSPACSIAATDSLPVVIGGDLMRRSGTRSITNLRKQFPESVLPSSCRTKYRFCPDYIFQRLAPSWAATPYRILDDSTDPTISRW
jgi:hypothetical protein